MHYHFQKLQKYRPYISHTFQGDQEFAFQVLFYILIDCISVIFPDEGLMLRPKTFEYIVLFYHCCKKCKKMVMINSEKLFLVILLWYTKS